MAEKITINQRTWRPLSLFLKVASKFMGTITHVSTKNNVVALTFDDGPHPDSTPQILDILKKHKAHATFFMLGDCAQRYPDLVRDAAQAGHAIGNHSWDHPSFPLISAGGRRAQIRACQKALAPYGSRLFRPPYGDQTYASCLDALLVGYQVVTWSVVATDWLDHKTTYYVDHLKKNIMPGSIVLLHDTLYHALEDQFIDRKPIFQAIDILLEQLGSRFSFTTLPELFRYSRPQKQLWYKTTDPKWLNRLKSQAGHVRQY